MKFGENPPSGNRVVEWGWKDGRADRQTDMTKLIVAFRNFAKAPKNSTLFKRTVFTYCVGSSEQRYNHLFDLPDIGYNYL